ncbi:hypothetical protein EV193_11035 [Herbihabitans rhizosphaerae]|uniref:Uncharacterized protein n=1 Tax=Herbihabitans rhizosphaerae TaxID=1872711 RepID=A0A4Q7KI64_9PSEU|nr:hypothetical protein [Herbihabitans rhizosphaerae]RZS33885.1 hypothetical protein EV193_11035 [Herbihabitans rhizosphaerae]
MKLIISSLLVFSAVVALTVGAFYMGRTTAPSSAEVKPDDPSGSGVNSSSTDNLQRRVGDLTRCYWAAMTVAGDAVEKLQLAQGRAAGYLRTAIEQRNWREADQLRSGIASLEISSVPLWDLHARCG